MQGTLPLGWAAPGSLPKLTEIYLGENDLSGDLPAAWGSAAAFQQLVQL